jgi:spermidine/putrescine transport system substrate-binding protein
VAAPRYLPESLDAGVLRYWFPLDGRGTVGNNLMTVLRCSRNPVLAHHFLNFLLDFDMAMLNLEWNGFQPPQVRVDPSLLVKQGFIPQPDHRGGQAGVFRDRLSRGGAGP